MNYMIRKTNSDGSIILLRTNHPCSSCGATATTFLLKSPGNLGSATRTCVCTLSPHNFSSDEMQDILLSGKDAFDRETSLHQLRRFETACRAQIPERMLWIFEPHASVDDATVLRCAAAAFVQRLRKNPTYSNMVKQSHPKTTLQEYDSTPCVCGHEFGAHDKRTFCLVCKKFCNYDSPSLEVVKDYDDATQNKTKDE